MRHITIKEVMHLTSLSKATIYRKVMDGSFPRPRHVGRASRWIESEVQEWLKAIADEVKWVA